MSTHVTLRPFNTRAAIAMSRLLPVATYVNSFPLTCINCKFINRVTNHFCTNCGHPVYPGKDNMAIYNLRVKRRKAMQASCETKMRKARTALYVLAGLLMLGLILVRSDDKQTIIKGVVMLVLSALYAGLARWSVFKPFTAFLISLMIMATFLAINTWTDVAQRETGFDLIYPIFLQGIFIYFLWQAVKAAFQAELLEEEAKI